MHMVVHNKFNLPLPISFPLFVFPISMPHLYFPSACGLLLTALRIIPLLSFSPQIAGQQYLRPYFSNVLPSRWCQPPRKPAGGLGEPCWPRAFEQEAAACAQAVHTRAQTGILFGSHSSSIWVSKRTGGVRVLVLLTREARGWWSVKVLSFCLYWVWLACSGTPEGQFHCH